MYEQIKGEENSEVDRRREDKIQKIIPDGWYSNIIGRKFWCRHENSNIIFQHPVALMYHLVYYRFGL
jgi:hypothetical protein